MKLSLEYVDGTVQQWPVEYQVGQAVISLFDLLNAYADETTLYLLDEYGEIVDEIEGVNPVTTPLVLDNLLS
jgi:hypothetical protein